MIDLDSGVDSDRCQHCEAPVTDHFGRVFGDENDVAHRCPECDSYRRLSRGSAAGVSLPGHPDPETTDGHHGNESVATDGGRRHDRGQTNVGSLVFAIVGLSLSVAALLMVIAA